MNKTIIGIIIGVLVLVGLVWIAQPDGQNSNIVSETSTGMLAVADTSNHDFGTISMAEGNVSHTFKITNNSEGTVVINKLYTSCMCTTAKLFLSGKQFGPFSMPGHGAIPKVDQSINPGEEAEIEVVFDPQAHGPAGVGKIQRTITIENNAGQPIVLQFSAIVTP